MCAFKLFVAFTVAAFIGVAHAFPKGFKAELLQYKELCMSYSGSDEGYRDTLRAIPPAKACFLDHVDILDLQIDLAMIAERSLKEYLAKYCPMFNESVSCFDGVLEGAAKCTGENLERVVPVFRNIAYGLVELACRDGEQFVTDVFGRGVFTCLRQVKENVGECKVLNVTALISLAHYSEEQCQEVEKSRQCIKNVIDLCESPATYDLLSVFYDNVMKASNCNEYTKVDELHNNNIEGVSSDE